MSNWLIVVLIVAVTVAVFSGFSQNANDCKAAGGVYVRAATTTGYACVKTEVIEP